MDIWVHRVCKEKGGPPVPDTLRERGPGHPQALLGCGGICHQAQRGEKVKNMNSQHRVALVMPVAKKRFRGWTERNRLKRGHVAWLHPSSGGWASTISLTCCAYIYIYPRRIDLFPSFERKKWKSILEENNIILGLKLFLEIPSNTMPNS